MKRKRQEKTKLTHLGPYELGKVHCVDALEALPQLPDGCVDLVLTDPPYGKGEDCGQWKSRNANRTDRRNGSPIIVRHKGYKPKKWDLHIPPREAFEQMRRVGKNQVIFGGNYFSEYLGNSPCWIAWDKVNGACDFGDCELAWTSFSSAIRLIRYMWCGFLQGKSIKDGATSQGNKALCDPRIHPTQKPVPLIRWILENYSASTDIILDPFMGSGTTGVAAVQLGRQFLGFEIDPEYCELANTRIKAARRGLTVGEYKSGVISLFEDEIED